MKVIAYHFWSPTCGPCKVIKPAIEDLKEEFENVTWISVNTHDDKEDYSTKFGVTIVPTIVVTVVDDSNKIIYSERHLGTRMAEYYRIVRSALRHV